MDLSIVPNANWQEELPNYSPNTTHEMLKFKWYVTSFANDEDNNG